MEHLFIEGKEGGNVIVTLHGTGGNERDIAPLGQRLDPNASILSVRGKVSENGTLRFFKRKEEGIYDLEDLEARGQELSDFIQKAGKEYGFTMDQVVLSGFSNGANIAINLLLEENSPFKRGILYAPMYPVDLSNNKEDLYDVAVYLSMGENDPIVTKEDSLNVIKLFYERGAKITEYWVNSHELTSGTLDAGTEWLKEHS